MLVFYVGHQDTATDVEWPYVRKLDYPTASVDSATAILVSARATGSVAGYGKATGARITDGELTACQDEDGIIAILLEELAAEREACARYCERVRGDAPIPGAGAMDCARGIRAGLHRSTP
mgnify:CR=1 FL=1